MKTWMWLAVAGAAGVGIWWFLSRDKDNVVREPGPRRVAKSLAPGRGLPRLPQAQVQPRLPQAQIDTLFQPDLTSPVQIPSLAGRRRLPRESIEIESLHTPGMVQAPMPSLGPAPVIASGAEPVATYGATRPMETAALPAVVTIDTAVKPVATFNRQQFTIG